MAHPEELVDWVQEVVVLAHKADQAKGQPEEVTDLLDYLAEHSAELETMAEEIQAWRETLEIIS